MKKLKAILALALAFVMIFATACTTIPPVTETPDTSDTDTSAPDNSKPDDGDKTYYNVIFALASIPPVLSALEAIGNGYPTYAIIERGKTYSGIEELENFHNVGFDPATNLTNGLTNEMFDAMVAKVKELNESTENAYFNFYVQDGTALLGAAISANAGIGVDQFHVIMCEDGTGAYDQFYQAYIEDRTVTAEKDEIYDNYVAQVKKLEAVFNSVMSKTDNGYFDEAITYHIPNAYALAALDNFTFYIQDEQLIVDYLENTGDVKTKLLSSFGVEGYDAEVEYKLNLKYGKISDAVSKLTEAQRTDYLKLMYGQYFEDTYAALTRTERAGETAPAKKLVYIGARHSGYAHFASNAAYGIGAIETVPATYAELDAKYKTALLFPTEADYLVFLNEINDAENYVGEASAQVKAMVAAACFNNYIDYIFNLKHTYALYGADYDIIMKGHPREVIGAHEEWGGRYNVTYGEDQKYNYDKLMDNVLLGFHASDSTGKYIGMVPYGTAAENLAYLGANIAIAGLPSSTYNGFDTAVDVVFITCETNQDIAGTGSDTAASQVKERYVSGTLTYVNKDGEKVDAEFYNIGNMYKSVAAIYTEAGDSANAAVYTQKFNEWLAANRDGATDIDAQGFARTAQ